MERCDVLIVGAGIAGASAAYELAQSARVIVLERESQAGYHTTGRSAAATAVTGDVYRRRARTAAARTRAVQRKCTARRQRAGVKIPTQPL